MLRHAKVCPMKMRSQLRRKREAIALPLAYLAPGGPEENVRLDFTVNEHVVVHTLVAHYLAWTLSIADTAHQASATHHLKSEHLNRFDDVLPSAHVEESRKFGLRSMMRTLWTRGVPSVRHARGRDERERKLWSGQCRWHRTSQHHVPESCMSGTCLAAERVEGRGMSVFRGS